MILVSACLLGENCRYNGSNCLVPSLPELLRDIEFKVICPEVAAGLPVPRSPIEIRGGDGADVLNYQARIENQAGEDITERLLQACQQILSDIAEEKIDFVILKEKSPSCGVHRIYSGRFDGTLKPGMGVMTAIFRKMGIEVFSEEELELIKKIIA
jgi:uncharacterized protein YbbK (DUF523 family)